MAQIQASNDTSMLKIKTFLGLNENPDGSTVLKVGELSEMRNFRITQDGHLQIRPGSHKLFTIENVADFDESVQYLFGAWNGIINGVEHTIVAYNGNLYDVNIETGVSTLKGTCTKDETTFFGFGNKVYMLNGHEYKSWDGDTNTNFVTVDGYIPTIMTSTEPTGEGHSLDARNHLTGKVKVEFDANGSATSYTLGEKDLTSVDSVVVDGTSKTITTDYTVNLATGVVTFTTAPAAGTNNVVIGYTKGTGDRSVVEQMHYSEFFNGSSDTRVFLYGDGSNKTIYSGLDSDGKPTADYFPENYEVEVGEENTPITSLVRHYSRMLAFKPDSSYQMYGQIKTLDNDVTEMAYYLTPVNRQFGNEAMGQVKLLENNPVSLDSGAAFQWKAYATNSSFSSNEQNASRISDKVVTTLKNFDFSKTKMYNLKNNREYWFVYNKTALVLNYVNSSWYVYKNLPFDILLEINNKIYGISNDSRFFEFSRTYRNDEGGIRYSFNSATWESSSFGGQDGRFRFDFDGSKWFYDETEVTLSNLGFTISENPTKNSTLNLSRTTTDDLTTSTNVAGLTVTADKQKFLAAYKYWFHDEDFPTGTYTVTLSGTMWVASINGASKPFGSTEQMEENLFIKVTGTPASGDTFTITYTRTTTYVHNEYSAIDAYAATGSMDFEKDWILKTSPMIFVATQPESNSRVTVTVESNKRSDYAEKVVANNLSTFLHLDFNHFSFGTNRKPRVKRLKIKVKKATYYKMIFKSSSTSATATILETDVKTREAGEVK